MNKKHTFILVSALCLAFAGCISSGKTEVKTAEKTAEKKVVETPVKNDVKPAPAAAKPCDRKPCAVNTKFSVANVISDNMVLQREMKVPVWGKAAPGAEVTVEFAGQTVKATAGKCGRWIAYLAPMKASKVNRTMTVTCGKERVSVKNILVGEVWLCSGQSNMEMPMWTNRPRWRAADGDKYVKAANFPQIRIVVTRPYGTSATPDDSFKVKWEPMSSKNTERFSATAFFFGTRLHREMNIPIGLITSHWGGTRIEPWTPPCGFDTVPELKNIADSVNAKVPGTATYKKFAKNTQAAYAQWMTAFAQASESGEILPMPPAFPSELDTSHIDRRTPTAIYNKMIVPYLPYAIRGAIWYQGCSNLRDGMLYAHKMQALLNGWRKVFNNPDMRFYYVQLAPYTYGGNKTSLAQLWEAQQAFEDANDRKVGMVVINDVGDFTYIHPRDKKTVGYRLADLALSRDYGKSNINALYPRLIKHEVKDGKFILTFKNVKNWKVEKDWSSVDTFQVSDATCNFKKAHVTARGNQLIVWSDEVPNPVNLRYMWLHVCAGKLFNENGLPLGAFRIEKKADEAEIVKALIANNNRLVEKYDVKKRKRLVDVRSQDKKPFTTVTYLITATDKNNDYKWLAVTMDAYTSDAKLVGMPHRDTKIRFQKYVNNISILGNVPQFAGRVINRGNIEFWPHNYGGANAAKIPGASGQNYDFGDEISSSMGYGSMQLHDYKAKTTIFAINNLQSSNVDFGFGNATFGKNPDWTFTKSGKDYKNITVYTFIGGVEFDQQVSTLINDIKNAGNRLVESYNVKTRKRHIDVRARENKPFSRITYLVTATTQSGKFQWLEVSMDAYTKDAKLVGVPLKDTKIKFQKYVNNVRVRGNVPGFTGKSIASANIEFWSNNYAGQNQINIPGASSKTYDFGDMYIPSGGYGSMQIHDYKAKTTIFALNGFHSANPDFGFGNSTGKNADWTFAQNAKEYKSINIYTFLSNK